mmetsp:Transcript_48869/g.140464  ORF Transcript_48869/g.140464 Transcript_48869/m.140464 type:complete len:268 (+) Transcript_48869:153-956(+)
MHASLRNSRWLVAIGVKSLHTVSSQGCTRGGPHDCELLGPVGIAVQIAITIVCALSMIAVWLLEPVRRPFFVWAFDMSKQVIAAGYGKAWNIAQSIVFAHFLRGHDDYQDQCVWYMMSITIDCLFLTFMCWGVHTYTRPIWYEKFQIEIGEYESYEDPGFGSDDSEQQPQVHHGRPSTLSEKVRLYVEQLFIWLGIITVCRLVISIILFFGQHQIYVLFADLFYALGLVTQTQKLIFSVLVWPFFADTFQIVVQDSFLKKNRAKDCD